MDQEPQCETAPAGRLNRRRLLKQLGLGLAGLGLGGAGYVVGVEPHWADFHERTMPLRNLPKQLVGKTIVQLSDLHIGPIVADDYLRRAFRQVADLKPDLVVMTGDFLTLDKGQIPREQMAAVLADFPHGCLGTYAVLGNHDYGRRWSELKAALEVSEMAHAAGITVLRNECVNTHGLLLAGVDDYWSPTFRPNQIVNQVDLNTPTILLCHNPDAVDANVWGPFQGWVLSGHTHGGQCHIPGYGSPIVPIKNKRYVAGEIELGHGRTLYVNRGLGYSCRVRFAARPEVTIFRLADTQDPTA